MAFVPLGTIELTRLFENRFLARSRFAIFLLLATSLVFFAIGVLTAIDVRGAGTMIAYRIENVVVILVGFCLEWSRYAVANPFFCKDSLSMR